MPRLFWILWICCLCVSSGWSQVLILRDNSRIPDTEFTVESNAIFRLVKIGDKVAPVHVPVGNIARMEWPEPVELMEVKTLISQGKLDEAVAVLKRAYEFFKVFETVEGTWHPQIFFAYVETLAQAGRFDEVQILLPRLKTLVLSESQKLTLRVLQLDMDSRTEVHHAAILAEAQKILSSTDDSAIGATVWIIIADIHAKEKEWENALMAYLRVPVFFGNQVQKVPLAELRAGQMLAKMKRYDDAREAFTRIVESYPDTAVATIAAKAKETINGLKNEIAQEPEEPVKKS